MITQNKIGLNSRGEANPCNGDGFLPLITAPMFSVVDESNYQMFLDNKIRVCLPRNLGKNRDNFITSYPTFISLSLQEFIEQYINRTDIIKESLTFAHKVCIDTANGNIPDLHTAIRKAKEIHGNNLIIMAGNVASVEAFIELAKTGVDYIRVGIGGGGGCNTTSNTGVGQENLEKLITNCKACVHIAEVRKDFSSAIVETDYYLGRIEGSPEEMKNISKVKIIADGISSYIKQCESEYGFNDNGYAAINKLLFVGADLVMIGKLFAQCLESAGKKRYEGPIRSISGYESTQVILHENHPHVKQIINAKKIKYLQVKYSGMSTVEEQQKYRENTSGHSNYKPSEGSVQWIPVRWTLSEWLNGSDNQDQAPYLMGWINSIKSAMAYTGKNTLSKND